MEFFKYKISRTYRNAVTMFNLRNDISTIISNVFRNAIFFPNFCKKVNYATINSFLLNYLVSLFIVSLNSACGGCKGLIEASKHNISVYIRI